MKFSKLSTLFLAGTLLFNLSCRKDDPIPPPVSLGKYENGILITNEGGFSTPTSTVTYLSNDLGIQEENIFGTNNSNAILGNVLQSVGFKGDLAYLVLNVPNKIEIVNRHTFKKTGSITSNLEQARYVAFSANNTYVTNNNFSTVKKVNIYDHANAFVKSIDFPNYAEKITSSDGFIYVQTDGLTYDSNYNEIATGHTISRINPATNTVDKTITLNDTAIIRDLVSDQTSTYVLSSDAVYTYLYKINSKTGAFTQQEVFDIPNGEKLAVDGGQVYFVTAGKKVYRLDGSNATPLFDVDTSFIYGFNIIDSKVFVSDPNFSGNSKVRIYNLSGTLMKTITTGISTNGFYKN